MPGMGRFVIQVDQLPEITELLRIWIVRIPCQASARINLLLTDIGNTLQPVLESRKRDPVGYRTPTLRLGRPLGTLFTLRAVGALNGAVGIYFHGLGSIVKNVNGTGIKVFRKSSCASYSKRIFPVRSSWWRSAFRASMTSGRTRRKSSSDKPRRSMAVSSR